MCAYYTKVYCNIQFFVRCEYAQVVLPDTSCCVVGGSPTAFLGIPFLGLPSPSSLLWHSQLKWALALKGAGVLSVVVSIGNCSS